MDKIIVLLAAYNGEKFIEEQIESILNQKDIELQLYISCDLSTDKTMSILEKIKSLHDNIYILPYGNRYGAAAPNFYRLVLDVDFSSCDYVAFADQDDIWLDDKLISGINNLKQNDCAGYSSNVTAFWENGLKKNILKATPQQKYDYLFEGPGPGCSFVFTKNLAIEFQNQIKKNKLLMKHLDWHDWLLYAFARGRSYSWYIDSESHMLYRQHSNNQLGANSGTKQFIKRVNNIVSGYGIKQTISTVHFVELEHEPFVQKWLNNGRKGYFYLAFHSKLCRRKNKDKFFFFLSCFIMFIKNIKMD